MRRESLFLSVILLCFALLVSSCASSTSVGAHQINEVDYEIQIPAKWKREGNDNSKTFIADNIYEDGAFVISIEKNSRVKKFNNSVFVMDELDADEKEALLLEIPPKISKVIASGYLKLNDGHTALYRYYLQPRSSGEGEMFYYKIYVIRGTEVFTVFWAPNSEEVPDKKKLDEITEIMKTFKVGKKDAKDYLYGEDFVLYENNIGGYQVNLPLRNKISREEGTFFSAGMPWQWGGIVGGTVLSSQANLGNEPFKIEKMSKKEKEYYASFCNNYLAGVLKFNTSAEKNSESKILRSEYIVLDDGHTAYFVLSSLSSKEKGKEVFVSYTRILHNGKEYMFFQDSISTHLSEKIMLEKMLQLAKSFHITE